MDNESSRENGDETANSQTYQHYQADHNLPSERFGRNAHIPVLKNLVLRTRGGEKLISTGEIEDGLRTQSASLNIKFLADLGLATREKRKYRPTETCVEFVRTLAIDEARAKELIRPLVEKSWFGQAARRVLELGGSIPADELGRELALEARVSDYEAKERSFRVLVDYLEWVEVLARSEDGDLRLAEPRKSELTLDGPEEQDPPPAGKAAEPPSSSSANAQSGGSTFSPSARQAPDSAAPNSGGEGWIHREWPGLYFLRLKPTPKAVRVLEATIQELKQVIEIATDEDADSRPVSPSKTVAGEERG